MRRRTPLRILRTCLLPVLALAIGQTGQSAALVAGEVSFRNDVMAVLSKAGCNMGTCHGNKYGKGGFRLSLRGENPDHDYAVLTRDLSGRRVNAMQPDRSLLLLKPTMELPHEGGRRFAPDSIEYRLLHDWLAAGMPADVPRQRRLLRIEVEPKVQVLVEPESELTIRVQAHFSDGVRTDVSRLAVYETSNPIVTISPDGRVRRDGLGETTVLVRYLDQQFPVELAFIPARTDFTWQGPEPANDIDEHVFAKLRTLRINPSAVSDDLTFLRRAHLDLLGVLPTADEARRFAAETRPDKRARLIDDLLERPEFAEAWALKWSDLLRNEEKTLDRKGVQNFYQWIRVSIEQNKPLDQFARELVASRGSTYTSPAANYYRAMRDPVMRAESTAQLFLGVRLQCAQCHSHPFDRWTQDDYYSWTNLFARVDYKVLENNRRDRNDKHEFDGEQIVFMKPDGDVNDPRSGKPLPPRFLERSGKPVSADEDRLLALADWIASPENELFVQSQANRIWYQLMGRGIVDPIDDFRATNPPSNPALLEALADDFRGHGFDLRHLVRTIMNSRTYQLSSVPDETNADDERNFARAYVRRLTAEQLLDGLASATGATIRFSGYPEGTRAGQLPGTAAPRRRDEAAPAADEFLRMFGKPPRLQTCECERSDETTLSQTFQLVSGPFLNDLLHQPGNHLDRWASSQRSSREIIEDLYWSTLTRPPTPDEAEITAAYLERASDRRSALEDIAWSLLNANEFLLRR